jgi:Domain of unknown function (DUF4440)
MTKLMEQTYAQRYRRIDNPQPRLCRFGAELRREAFRRNSGAGFYCTNPDKSLVDRAAFLKQTAIPVTIRNLIADDVKIRVIGDFAIIHARTSYTTADGKQAFGRYTDCWAKQNGRWLAVAAHVAR